MDFQTAYNSMTQYLKDNNSKITDFTQTSVAGQIISSVASLADTIDFATADAREQAYISTASGVGLDKKGNDANVPRKAATSAIWSFSFYKNLPSDTVQYAISAGAKLSTVPAPNQAPVIFTVISASYLPLSSASVRILCSCDTPGTAGNIAPSTPLLLASAITGIDGVTLVDLTNGTYGVDVETDDAYRTRLIAANQTGGQGTLAWYNSTALAVPGVTASRTVPQGRGAGTVDVYIVGANNALPSSGLIAAAQALFDAKRIITDDVQVFAPTAFTVNETITIKVAAGQVLATVQASVQAAIAAYINSLGIGQTGSSVVMYQSQILAAALKIDGVINATQTGQSDITFLSFQVPQVGTITVNAAY